jgi:hypothetical protein
MVQWLLDLWAVFIRCNCRDMPYLSHRQRELHIRNYRHDFWPPYDNPYKPGSDAWHKHNLGIGQDVVAMVKEVVETDEGLFVKFDWVTTSDSEWKND